MNLVKLCSRELEAESAAPLTPVVSADVFGDFRAELSPFVSFPGDVFPVSLPSISYSLTSVLASSGPSEKRDLRSRGNSGEAVGCSSASPPSPRPPSADVEVDLGVGDADSGLGSTALGVKDWVGPKSGRRRGLRGAVRGAERRVAL